MSKERVPHARDRLARLAAQQHGVVTLHQLYSLGFSDSQVGTRVSAGWLRPLHRAVFAVGRPTVTTEGHWLAAVLTCGDSAVLSHQAAGELWGSGVDGRAERSTSRFSAAAADRPGERSLFIASRSSARMSALFIAGSR